MAKRCQTKKVRKRARSKSGGGVGASKPRKASKASIKKSVSPPTRARAAPPGRKIKLLHTMPAHKRPHEQSKRK